MSENFLIVSSILSTSLVLLYSNFSHPWPHSQPLPPSSFTIYGVEKPGKGTSAILHLTSFDYTFFNSLRYVVSRYKISSFHV